MPALAVSLGRASVGKCSTGGAGLRSCSNSVTRIPFLHGSGHRAASRPVIRSRLTERQCGACSNPSHRSRGLSKSSQVSPNGRTQVRVAAQAGWSTVDVEQGKTMLDRQGYKFLDLRSEREFDNERLTKPARCSINVPLLDGSNAIDPSFQSRVAAKVPRTEKLLVATRDGGEASAAAMQLLLEAGYSNAVEVEGGFTAWVQIFSTSGRRKPPPGRWVSTGTEALKSGLNVGDAALSYDEGGNATEARWAGSPNGESSDPSP